MEGGYYPEENMYGIGQYHPGGKSPLTLLFPRLFMGELLL
jgi:hypothetical protein